MISSLRRIANKSLQNSAAANWFGSTKNTPSLEGLSQCLTVKLPIMVGTQREIALSKTQYKVWLFFYPSSTRTLHRPTWPQCCAKIRLTIANPFHSNTTKWEPSARLASITTLCRRRASSVWVWTSCRASQSPRSYPKSKSLRQSTTRSRSTSGRRNWR